MRYTRYDYKKKKNNNGGFITFLLLVVILSIGIGISIFKIFFNGENKIVNKEKKSQTSEVNADLMNGEKTFIAIQCGVYSSKENAEKAVNGLPSSYSGFLNEEDGKFKVMAGIFGEEEGNTKSDELAATQVENYKTKLTIKISDNDSKVMSEIIEAYLKINNTLSNNEVKSVKTEELKKWVKDLEENQKINGDEVKELVAKINNFPEEVTKSNMKENTIFIYNLLVKNKS